MTYNPDNPMQTPPPPPDECGDESPMETAKRKFGWKPDFVFSVAGVTFKDHETGLNRQDLVLMCHELVQKYGHLPVLLQREPDNKYDPDAIKVVLPTRDDEDGNLIQWRQLGYVPIRYCPKCYNSWGGRKKDSADCPVCKVTVAAEDTTYLNRYLVPILDATEGKMAGTIDSEGAKLGVLWATKGGERVSRGIKVALKL